MKRTISILVIIIILAIFCASAVLASSPEEIIQAVGKPTADNGFLNTAAGKVLGVIQIIGAIAATVMILVIAIKFMTAAPAEKGEVKNQLIGYTIGVIILVALIGILQVVASIGNQIGSMA